MQQILSGVGGHKLHQIQHPVGILAGIGDEVVGVDPGTGLVDRTIAIGSLEGGAHGQVVDDRVRIGGQPGALVEVAELSGIAEAEVHRADFAGTEIGVSVVKVALDADVALRTSCENLAHNLQKRKSV